MNDNPVIMEGEKTVMGEQVKMSERRLSVGINVSILVILTIFGLLLSLPLRLLLYTNYYTREQSVLANETTTTEEENVTVPEVVVTPVDNRKLRRCPRLQYEERLKSIFQCDYDRNCTYVRIPVVDKTSKKKDPEIKLENPKPDKEPVEQPQETKDIVVAGHILVTMLLASAIAALVEVLRIRFAKDKVQDRHRLSVGPRSQHNKLSKLQRPSVVHQIIECPGVNRPNRKRRSGGLLALSIIARV